MHCKAWVDHKHAHSDTNVLSITQRRHKAINLSSVDTTHKFREVSTCSISLTHPPPPPPLLPSPHFFFLWNRPIKALKQLELLPYSTCFLSHFPRPLLTCAQTHIQAFPHMHKHTASYVHSISLAEPLPPHPPNLCPADRPESQSAWRAVSRVRQNRQRVRRRGGNVGKIGPRRAS